MSTILAVVLLIGGFFAGLVAAVLYVTASDDETSPTEAPAVSTGTTDGRNVDPSDADRDPESQSLNEATQPLNGVETPGPPSPPEGDPTPDSAEPAPRNDHETASYDSSEPVQSEKTEKISREEIESMAMGDSEDEQAYLVVVSGNRVGEMIAVDTDLILGRDPDAADISFRDETVSSRHARLRRLDDDTIIEDLDSANGTFINARRVEKGTLQDGDKITLGRTTVLKFTFQDELDEEFQQQMYESSTRDQLTRALSKTHFLDRMETEISYARRHGTNTCVILFDLDHFKHINDTYGHVAGDQILQELGNIVRSITRDEALFARYGGEEFVIAERNAGIGDGSKIAERIRRTVEDHQFGIDDQSIQVTLSIGVADLETIGKSSTPTELLKAADNAMYCAKEAGRNCVATSRDVRRN